MRLQRIYSSKVYLTSSRKDKIKATIGSFENTELVQQISDYLDDGAKAELDQAISEEQAKESVDNQDSGSAITPSSSGSTASSGGGGSSFSGDVFKDFGMDDFSEEPMTDGDAGTEEPATDDTIEENTKLSGKSITAACQIWNTLDDVISDCDTIKGTLNSREDTAGVNRIEVKKSDAPELWIYYHDDANLNDKMVEVIEVLNSTGYTYLKFNRLARSNNAIVFDINLNTTDIKTTKEIEDEK